MNYFSVRIAILCIADETVVPEDGYTQDIQVHIVKAINFSEAFQKALEIGKNEEDTYRNEANQTVRWIFREVEAITDLGAEIEGKEVSSRMEGYYPQNPISVSTQFEPEKSTPIYNDENCT